MLWNFRFCDFAIQFGIKVESNCIEMGCVLRFIRLELCCVCVCVWRLIYFYVAFFALDRPSRFFAIASFVCKGFTPRRRVKGERLEGRGERWRNRPIGQSEPSRGPPYTNGWYSARTQSSLIPLIRSTNSFAALYHSIWINTLGCIFTHDSMRILGSVSLACFPSRSNYKPKEESIEI